MMSCSQQLRPIVKSIELHSDGRYLKGTTSQKNCDEKIKTILDKIRITKESRILCEAFNWDDDAWLAQAKASISALFAEDENAKLFLEGRYDFSPA